MPLQWNRELETGIRELDVQQQELFAKFELFSAAIELEHGHKQVEEFFHYLDHYAQEHFKYEEDMQERSKFPERAEHVTAHRRFVEELEAFKAGLRSGRDAQEIALAVKATMIRWIISHSKHMDRAFNDYLLAASEKAKGQLVSKKLGEILVNSQIVSAVTVERALVKQQETGRKLGLILVEMGVVSRHELKNALMAQEGKSLYTEKIGHILVESGLISYETMERALLSQKTSDGKLVGQILVEMGVIEQQEVMYAQAVQKGMLPRESAV